MKIILIIFNAISLGLYDLISRKKVYYIWLLIISAFLVLKLMSYLNDSLVYIVSNIVLLVFFVCCFISPIVCKDKFNSRICRKFLIILHLFLVFNILFLEENVVLATNIGSSMQPTLKDGQILILKKYNGDTKLNRGDIVLFRMGSKLYTKRIFAIPNDEINVDYKKICNGNNCLVDENSNLINSINFIVPDFSYFVLGDNLKNSRDSRYFKETFVNVKDIEYVYLGILY
ncbi:signal peptidase I [Vibrio sp. SCSIO 43155]|uniref:signal peptidase I n=1 Tax=Vibrio TaxID=662 RepID=UPI002189C487|nr:signal peptidase I [Vibrio sp. SCSIO 43155]CAH1544103.1 Signal peptidase I [Vibrio harveyi]